MSNVQGVPATGEYPEGVPEEDQPDRFESSSTDQRGGQEHEAFAERNDAEEETPDAGEEEVDDL